MSDTSPTRILVVDDEVAQMKALCDTLMDHGYETAGFTSGQAALAALPKGRFDLLLTDLTMPEMDGIALLQAALTLDANIVCIIMTGKGSIATAVQAMQAGALDYILKPFKLSGILPVLSRALAVRRLRLENARLERNVHERTVELEAVNAKLEQATRAKSDFLSSMSHELRTPLNAILGFGEILVSEDISSTPLKKLEFTHHILKAGRHLLALINEILDLTHVESGKMALYLEPVAVAEVLRECQKMTEPMGKKRTIHMVFAQGSGQHVRADPMRLKQVLLNLLSNAIKYNRDGGSVVVDVAVVENGCIRISVQDSGMGLHLAQLNELFQPFNRLGQERGPAEGTGIGLVLTKRLVELMGGEIGVNSTPGIGSTFWIELQSAAPRALSKRVIDEATLMPIKQPNASRLTLLYVEDNPASLKLVQEIIGFRADLRMLSAPDGKLGQELAIAHLPDVILLDLNLPGLSGHEVQKRLQNDPRTHHIPVIALTADAMQSDIERGLAAGFFRYLTKPINLAEFGDAIDQALQASIERRTHYPTGGNATWSS